MTIVISLKDLEHALIEHIKEVDFDEFSIIAGKIFGGDCCYWGGEDEIFRFYPNENYTGNLNNFEE